MLQAVNLDIRKVDGGQNMKTPCLGVVKRRRKYTGGSMGSFRDVIDKEEQN